MLLDLGMYAALWHVGGKLGAKYLSPDDETPVLTEQLGDALVSVTMVRQRGKKWCRLYVATEGQSAMVQQGTYPELIAALQIWGPYLENGGTVGAWLANNARTSDEVAQLEQSL